MKMYRNYDGNKSKFGDVSVSAGGPNPDNVAVFASQRTSDSALTVMVISKYLSGNTLDTINLANFQNRGVAQPWQLTSSNTINHLADLNFSATSFAVTLPPQSITLFVIPAALPGNQPPAAFLTATPTSGPQPLNVAFNGSGSSDPDGTIVSYAWNFGDGSTGSGVTTSHTYTASGNFTSKLTVTDDKGATGTGTVGINVTTVTINPPSSLSAKVSGSTVTLTWVDNSNNEEGFYIERAPKGGTFARIGTVGANVKTFAQTVTKGTYVYRVQAFSNTLGKVSAYSNQANARVR